MTDRLYADFTRLSSQPSCAQHRSSCLSKLLGWNLKKLERLMEMLLRLMAALRRFMQTLLRVVDLLGWVMQTLRSIVPRLVRVTQLLLSLV